MALLPIELRAKSLAYFEAFQNQHLLQTLGKDGSSTHQLQTRLETAAQNGNVGEAAVAAVRLLRRHIPVPEVASQMQTANEKAGPLYEKAIERVASERRNWFVKQMDLADLEVAKDSVAKRANRWQRMAARPL